MHNVLYKKKKSISSFSIQCYLCCLDIQCFHCPWQGLRSGIKVSFLSTLFILFIHFVEIQNSHFFGLSKSAALLLHANPTCTLSSSRTTETFTSDNMNTYNQFTPFLSTLFCAYIKKNDALLSIFFWYIYIC